MNEGLFFVFIVREKLWDSKDEVTRKTTYELEFAILRLDADFEGYITDSLLLACQKRLRESASRSIARLFIESDSNLDLK